MLLTVCTIPLNRMPQQNANEPNVTNQNETHSVTHMRDIQVNKSTNRNAAQQNYPKVNDTKQSIACNATQQNDPKQNDKNRATLCRMPHSRMSVKKMTQSRALRAMPHSRMFLNKMTQSRTPLSGMPLG